MSNGAPSVLPAADDKAAAVEAMFDRIAGRYDRLNRILTLRMDLGWRRTAARELALSGRARVLDIACGTGDFCRELDRCGHTAIGVDFSAGMLAAARARVPLVRADALRLPVRDGCLDGLTCGFALRNFTAIEPVLAESARVLRDGGRIVLLDVAEPESRLVRVGHAFWFRHVVPFVGGRLSDREAYRYLPESTSYLPEPSGLRAMVRDAGFDAVQRRTFLFGTAQLITATRRIRDGSRGTGVGNTR
jgi:demethylmenaquinone methyltransferase/2-methoxy-6-polyprenyl-1,4-benzoquinol methylase